MMFTVVPFSGVVESGRAKEVLEAVQSALRETVGADKRAAIEMNTTPAQLSRGLNGRQEALVSKLAALGERFEAQYIRRRAAKVGLRVIDADLAEIVEEVR